jgi:hypothetical protein
MATTTKLRLRAAECRKKNRPTEKMFRHGVEPFKRTILPLGRPAIIRPWSGTEHYVEHARECPSFNL